MPNIYKYWIIPYGIFYDRLCCVRTPDRPVGISTWCFGYLLWEVIYLANICLAIQIKVEGAVHIHIYIYTYIYIHPDMSPIMNRMPPSCSLPFILLISAALMLQDLHCYGHCLPHFKLLLQKQVKLMNLPNDIVYVYIYMGMCQNPGPRWICGSLLFNRVLNGGHFLN